MNKRKYSYVMMDANQFERYQRHCKRNGEPCNYHLVNSSTYGVMIANEQGEKEKVGVKEYVNDKDK